MGLGLAVLAVFLAVLFFDRIRRLVRVYIVRYPPIHDIATDTEDPPRFVKVLALRKSAPNPPAYGGPEVAEQQKRAYPDLAPLMLGLPPERAFGRALEAARAMGWAIADADEARGRIEATAVTPVCRFKDDVVVRVRAQGDGARVDVRSVSRVGVGDLGANARRIREYLARLKGP